MSLPQETKGALDVPTPKRLSWGLSALFEDPISYEVMSNPVMIPCGHSFDRESLSSWLNTRHACPVCQKPTQADQMASNYLLKEIIERYEKKKIELQTQPALPAAIDASSSSLFITSSAPAPSSSLSDLLYPFPHSSSSVDTTVHSAPSSSSSSVASFSPAAAAAASSSEPTVASSTTDHASTLRFRTNDSDIRVIELSAATASITYLGAVEKWSTISTSPGVSTGMHRWECNINRTERGVIMIGVMTPDCAVGKGHYLGDSSKSWGMLGVNGTLWNDSHKQRYASQGFRVNTIIGMILDCDRRTLSFDMNGQQLGLAAADLPLPLCFGLSFFNPDDRLEVNAFSSLKPEIGFCFSKLPKALNMVGLSELQHAGKEDQWHTAMSSVPIASGVHEWTVHIRVSKKGTLLIGLISSAAPNLPEGFYIGNNPSSWGLLGINGTTWHAAAKTKYSSGFRSGDSVTLRYDANSGVVEYFINQKGLGVAFTNVVPPVNFAISLFHCNDFVSIDSYTKFHTSSLTSPPVARIRSSSLLSSTAASSSSSLLSAPLSSAPVVSFAASSSALLEVNGGRVTHRTPEGWATIVVNGNEPTAGRIVQQSFFIEASFKGHILVGVCSVSEPLPDYLGSTPFSWGLLGINATFWRASTKDKTAVSRFGSGDLVTIVIDGIQRTLAFSVNGSPATTVDTFTCTNCRFAVSLFSANDSISLS